MSSTKEQKQGIYKKLKPQGQKSRKGRAITCSETAENVLIPFLALQEEEVENFNIITMRRDNSVIEVHHISKGGLTGTVADLRVIFKKALLDNATSIILSHNHPSGLAEPSQADKQVTHEIVAAGKIMQITVLDHLITAGIGNYYSFADNCLI